MVDYLPSYRRDQVGVIYIWNGWALDPQQVPDRTSWDVDPAQQLAMLVKLYVIKPDFFNRL
jgi:hypothetical protein